MKYEFVFEEDFYIKKGESLYKTHSFLNNRLIKIFGEKNADLYMSDEPLKTVLFHFTYQSQLDALRFLYKVKKAPVVFFNDTILYHIKEIFEYIPEELYIGF